MRRFGYLLLAMALAVGLMGCDLGPISGGNRDPGQMTTEATTVPLDYLAEGYYLLEEGTWLGAPLEQPETLRCYVQIDHHGTGLVSAEDVSRILVWEESVIRIEGESYLYTVEDNVLTLTGDHGILRFRYAGDTLPADYLPDGPAAGLYVVCAVTRNGQREEFSALRQENGYLQLNENGTGLLYFDGVTQRLTWDADGLYTLEGTVAFLYSPVDGLLTLYPAEGLALELRPGRSSN